MKSIKKSIFLFSVFLITLLFVSCKKESIIKDVKKCLQDGWFISTEVYEKLSAKKYDIYETDEQGYNLLTSPDIKLERSDIANLIKDYDFDVTRPDAIGNIPLYMDNNFEEYLIVCEEHEIDYQTLINKCVYAKTDNNYIDFNKCPYLDSFEVKSFFDIYIQNIDVNRKTEYDMSYFRYCCDLGIYYALGVFYNPNYKKNYDDYKYLSDNIRELDYEFITLYNSYAKFFVYNESEPFVPQRKIFMPGDEEYMQIISSDYLNEIPSYIGQNGDFYTMVKTQLKTDKSIIEIPCGTKVELLAQEGDPYIEDGYLVYPMRVKCQGKEGIMSNRYISYTSTLSDVDFDGKEEQLLANYSTIVSENVNLLCTIVLIDDGKPIEIQTNNEDKYYYGISSLYDEPKIMEFVKDTTILKGYFYENENSSFNLYQLNGKKLICLPLENIFIYDSEDSHSILSFIDMQVVKNREGLYRIFLKRDVDNRNCYDYDNYHYSISEEWYEDAFSYYYDYGDYVTIIEESDGYFTVDGEDANFDYYYEYYYGDYGL